MARILLVDDSEAVLALVQQVLISAGHDVLATESGEQAIRELAGAPVDLIITDLYMPAPDGFEIIAAVRTHGGRVPVLVMSANPVACGVFQAARVLGAVGALQKPFTATALNEAVASALASVPTSHRMERAAIVHSRPEISFRGLQS